jgi:hypothetical protein
MSTPVTLADPYGKALGVAGSPLPTSSVNADGSAQTALPPGRAAAAASVPVVLSTEDLAALRRDQVQTPVATTAAAASQIAKASAGIMYGINVVSGASAGYVMIFNAATVPADGHRYASEVLCARCQQFFANGMGQGADLFGRHRDRLFDDRPIHKNRKCDGFH